MKDRKQLRALEKEALEEASANNDDDEGDLKKENTQHSILHQLETLTLLAHDARQTANLANYPSW